MAATQQQSQFVGTSTSPLPTTGGDGSLLAPGSTFREADTGKVWVWDGLLWRFQAFADAQGVAGLGPLVSVLAEMRELLVEIRDEVRAVRLAEQAQVDAGSADSTDFLEMALSMRDGAEEM